MELTETAPVPVQRPRCPDHTQSALSHLPVVPEVAWCGWRASRSRRSGSWREGAVEGPRQRVQTSMCPIRTHPKTFHLRFVIHSESLAQIFLDYTSGWNSNESVSLMFTFGSRSLHLLYQSHHPLQYLLHPEIPRTSSPQRWFSWGWSWKRNAERSKHKRKR